MSKAKKPYKWVESAAVISALRRIFRRYPPFSEVRHRCRKDWFQDCKNGNKRRRVDFECEKCHTRVSSKEFVVDHIEPVINIETGYVDLNTFARRLFCPIANLQGLCVVCHNVKSKAENAKRRANRKDKK